MYPEGCRKREYGCYVPASIAFWGQKAVCWDNPNPLKVSGIFLTSLRLGDQTRCLLVYCHCESTEFMYRSNYKDKQVRPSDTSVISSISFACKESNKSYN